MAFASTPAVQDSTPATAELVYRACEDLARSLIDGVLLYRSGMETWPEDAQQLNTFLDFNDVWIDRDHWYAIDIMGRQEICQVRIKIGPDRDPGVFVLDSIRVRKASAVLYLAAAGDSAGFAQADLSGELIAADVELPSGEVIRVGPFIQKNPVLHRLHPEQLREMLGIE